MPRDVPWLDLAEEDPAFVLPEDDEFTGSGFQQPKKQPAALDSAPLSAAIEKRSSVIAARPVQPKPKWWQMLAAGAAGGAAGLVNASGRVRRPVDATAFTEEIQAPGYKRRLRDWMGEVETAEAGVKGAQQQQEADIEGLRAETAAENLRSVREERAARIADRKAARAAMERQAVMQPGVEEIRPQPPLETTVPSSVPGIPGQPISVAKPPKDYRTTFEAGGKQFGVRAPEEVAAERARIEQASWPTITQEMATAMKQPSLAGQKVPPNEFNEFVKMSQATTPTGKSLHIVKEGNDITGDVTVTGFDPLTMKQVAQVVLPKIAQKRPPAGPAPPASAQPGPGGSMSPEAFRRVQQLGNALKSEPNVKIYSEVKNSLEGMKDASTLGSAGDITLMRLFAKLTDPSTGVREEEYKAMLGAMGLLEKFNLFVSGKWIGGEKLTPAQRTNFINVAQKIHDSRARLVRPTVERYRKRAVAGGVDPELVFSEADIPAAPSLPGGAGGGTVKMRAPNGQTQDISPDQVEHFKKLGAVVVGQ